MQKDVTNTIIHEQSSFHDFTVRCTFVIGVSIAIYMFPFDAYSSLDFIQLVISST